MALQPFSNMVISSHRSCSRQADVGKCLLDDGSKNHIITLRNILVWRSRDTPFAFFLSSL
ncbi:hypothetical protein I7I50_06506 [Histoplasma capsulatum G186AR]|uniref:Uncharacterized protein n=1 Tax=Ajellomyces capsulatus TaxID=5037 RepID=A0A8H7Z2D0_AJECA|nr:hypothetical protein I7I52_10422 [Histoplasma capsulatum]QSS67431.1 hypothetical protein I7I50_06506 [Histoplasma capsulatum G186AR]